MLDEDKKGKGKAKAKAKDGEAETEKGVVAGEQADARPTVLNPAAAGLPTPAKTPSRKRNLAPEKVASSAQALFPPTEASSSRSASRAGGLFGVRRATRPPTTPRRKSVMGRIQEEEAEAAIEIFTDSDARRPKVDLDPDNPFLTRPGEETRSSKRIRQKRADKLNNRLSSDALRTDGMVYTLYFSLSLSPNRLPNNYPAAGRKYSKRSTICPTGKIVRLRKTRRRAKTPG